MPRKRAIAEAISTLLDDLVDPADAFLGDDGRIWDQVGSSEDLHANAGINSENQLDEIRAQCRSLAATNEWAINGHENRISYVIGTGHTYRAVPKDAREERTSRDTEAVQECIDEFLKLNRWPNRQQEILRRYDRDGEVFLRFFETDDGLLVRFIEPTQVRQPAQYASDPSYAFGIQTEPDDVENVLAYWVDDAEVSAADVQHRKANVDANVRRGLPLYYPVRKNLRRAEKLLRNMAATAEIQTAIGLIRKHEGLTSTAAQAFMQDKVQHQHTNQATGQTTYYRRMGPGTIIDAPRGVTYDFPASGINAAAFTEVLRAELRAIAARLVMPEYMFSSDITTSTYASTIAATTPAAKMFERLAATTITLDIEVIDRAIAHAIDSGKLPADVMQHVTINARPPALNPQDPVQSARINEIAYRAGILSAQTWAQRMDLDYDQEQENIAAHQPHECASCAANSDGDKPPANGKVKDAKPSYAGMDGYTRPRLGSH